MKKILDFKTASFNKFDVLACIYFLLVINQGIHIEALSSGRFKLLEIVPLFFLTIIGIQNFFTNFNKITKYIYISLSLLLMFSLLAAIEQQSVKPFLYVFVFVIISISCLNFANSSDNIDKNIFKFFKYILVINFFILISCLFFGDTKYLQIEGFYRFRGIFGNSNQLGRFCTISIVICLFSLFESYLKIDKGFKFISIFNLLLSLLLLLYSNSRLSLLVLFVASFAYIILNLSEIIKYIAKFRAKSLFFKSILILFFFLILVVFIFITKDAWIAISNKFLDSQVRDARGGLTGFRFRYILASLDYLNFFGYQDFKNETSICSNVLKNHTGDKLLRRCDVHNTYLNLWLKYGFYFALFLFYGLFCIFLFSISFNNHKPEFIFISKLVAVISISLLVYYFFETGILHVFFILNLVLLSYLIKEKINLKLL